MSDQHTRSAQSQDQGASNTSPSSAPLKPVEQELLDEYAKLLGNLNNMSSLLAELAEKPSTEMLDSLRGLERKTSLVHTLLKASVYSIVLNQEIQEEPGMED